MERLVTKRAMGAAEHPRGVGNAEWKRQALLFFHQPPPLLLDAAFGRLDDQELDALLQFGVTHGVGLTLIIVQGELILRPIGMDPFGAATTTRQGTEQEEKNQSCETSHEEPHM